MKKGVFVTFEGGEGAGKSTQARLLAEYLASLGVPVLVTREPGGTPISEKIRDILLDPLHRELAPGVELLLYLASRSQLVSQVIRPALGQAKSSFPTVSTTQRWPIRAVPEHSTWLRCDDLIISLPAACCRM